MLRTMILSGRSVIVSTILLVVILVVAYMVFSSLNRITYLNTDELEAYIQEEIPVGQTVNRAIETLQTGYFSPFGCFTFEDNVRRNMADVSVVGYDDISCYVPAPASNLSYFVAFVFYDGILEIVYVNTVETDAIPHPFCLYIHNFLNIDLNSC